MLKTFGCAILNAHKSSTTTTTTTTTTLLLKKCMTTAQTYVLPQLTLYTKQHCPLCDELVAELETDFTGQYQLEKVYIDRKENVKYLRLYRNDIPVLFLNNEFLCMHRLNAALLKDKLAQLATTQTKINN